MFAHDWPDEPPDDPTPEDVAEFWQRQEEQWAAAERFDRLYPDFAERLGRAVATRMQELAIDILTGEGSE